MGNIARGIIESGGQLDVLGVSSASHDFVFLLNVELV
jgi:hypothetical protein